MRFPLRTNFFAVAARAFPTLSRLDLRSLLGSASEKPTRRAYYTLFPPHQPRSISLDSKHSDDSAPHWPNFLENLSSLDERGAFDGKIPKAKFRYRGYTCREKFVILDTSRFVIFGFTFPE